MKRLATLGVLAAALLLPGAASAASLVPVADPDAWGSEPIYVAAPPNDQRLFIVERGDSNRSRPGVIRVATGNQVSSTPFLTVGNIDTFSERGLLSLAFSPDYATSGLFYVFAVAAGPDSLDPSGQRGDIRIVEYRRSATDANLADPASARLVFKTPHSAGNHNGGWLAFGPDGKLYFTIGDNANRVNAPNLGSVFGKVLRINPADPDGPLPAGGPLTATIPSDNPFVGTPGARGEVYTSGLRNPFRASFAPDGDLVIADVGENAIEEVNAGNLAGKNMGWPSCEGFCDTPTPAFTDPVFEYPHDPGGCAVLGGHVVRDPELTGLVGRYLYGDLCRDDLRTLNLKVPGADPGQAGIELTAAQGQLRSFGEDGRGCSYVVTSASVYRLAPSATSGRDCPRAAVPVDPPPLPDPAPEVTYETFIPNTRPIARKLTVAGRCSIDCRLDATATMRIGRNRFLRKVAKIRLTPEGASADAGVRTPVTMVLNGKALKRVRKAARRGSRISAFVKVTATGSDGSSGSGSSRIRLVRKLNR